MTTHEKLIILFARVACVVFCGMNLVTFSGIYGWLHPVVWGATLVALIAIEGLFYYIRGPRSGADMNIAVALWISAGVWVSVDNFIVTVSSIVVQRALPEGWPLRVASALIAATFVASISLADLNPWSSHPGDPWLRPVYMTSCLLNSALVLARASLPRTSA